MGLWRTFKYWHRPCHILPGVDHQPGRPSGGIQRKHRGGGNVQSGDSEPSICPTSPGGGGKSGRAGCEAAGCLAACWLDSPRPKPRERGGVGSPFSWANLCLERLKQNLRGLLALLGGAQRRCGPMEPMGESSTLRTVR